MLKIVQEAEEEELRREQEEAEGACEDGELRVRVIEKPANCRRLSKVDDKLSMHYTGRLFATGQKFDSSLDRHKPFDFTLGIGQVIKGWDDGVLGMCVGEKRMLIVPPWMAYGESGVGDVIPPCSTLVFDVELLDIV